MSNVVSLASGDRRPCQFLSAVRVIRDGRTEWDARGDLPDDPSAFMQWKGTDVCLDFQCVCGANGHFDGYFAQSLKCPACSRVFLMPTHVPLVEVGPEAYHFDNAKTVGADGD